MTVPTSEAPAPRRVGPPEVEALHEIDQIIGNQETISAEQLGEVRGLVLVTLNDWHRRYAASNLIAHAERELAVANVEEEVRPSIVQAVASFTGYYGHSGGSASVCIGILNDLLQFRALAPLTDDPSEWADVAEMSNGTPLWQNVRDSEAFSQDGGKTYYVLREERRWLRRLSFRLPRPVRIRLPRRVFFPVRTAVPR